MHSPDQPSWQNPKVLTTLLLVFLSGALAGALSMRIGLNHPAGPGDIDSYAVFVEKCKRELNLSPQQAQQIAAIMDDYKTYYDSVKEQLVDVRQTGKNRIMELLTEEQRKKFEKLTLEVPKQ